VPPPDCQAGHAGSIPVTRSTRQKAHATGDSLVSFRHLATPVDDLAGTLIGRVVDQRRAHARVAHPVRTAFSAG